MANKTFIDVIAVDKREGKSKRSGDAYSMVVCQAVVREIDDSGKQVSVKVGELILPKGHDLVAEGRYAPVMQLSVNFDKQVHAVIEKLLPVKS